MLFETQIQVLFMISNEKTKIIRIQVNQNNNNSFICAKFTVK